MKVNAAMIYHVNHHYCKLHEVELVHITVEKVAVRRDLCELGVMVGFGIECCYVWLENFMSVRMQF